MRVCNGTVVTVAMANERGRAPLVATASAPLATLSRGTPGSANVISTNVSVEVAVEAEVEVEEVAPACTQTSVVAFNQTNCRSRVGSNVHVVVAVLRSNVAASSGAV